MDSHATRRRLFRIAMILFLVSAILIGGDLVLVRSGRRLHPGYDTTRIDGPRLPDGSIDYLRALEDHFSREVIPENNAAIPILQALGRKALPPSQPVDGITNRLGMPHLDEKGDYYITSSDYFHDQESLDWIDGKASPAWPVTIDPKVSGWIKANDKPLALLTEASKRSRYFIPFNGGNRPETLVSIMLPHIGLLHDARRALMTRAVLRLQGNDTRGFVDDIRTGHKLARLLGQDSTMVGRLVAINLERSTCRTQRLGLASGKLSPEQIRQMLNDLASLGDWPSMAECVDNGERFIGLDVMQVMAKSNDEKRAELFNGLCGSKNPEILFRIWPVDYDKCMRSLNKGYDESLAALQKPTYAERAHAFDLLDLKLQLKRENHGPVRMMLSSDWPVMMLLPALRRASERVDLVSMDERLTEIQLALALFRSDHGDHPGALSELAPGYLQSVPGDVFSEKIPIYQPDQTGYTLYSVGPNAVDDHGNGDDILVNPLSAKPDPSGSGFDIFPHD